MTQTVSHISIEDMDITEGFCGQLEFLWEERKVFLVRKHPNWINCPLGRVCSCLAMLETAGRCMASEEPIKESWVRRLLESDTHFLDILWSMQFLKVVLRSVEDENPLAGWSGYANQITRFLLKENQII